LGIDTDGDDQIDPGSTLLYEENVFYENPGDQFDIPIGMRSHTPGQGEKQVLTFELLR
jgi:hypothetical protein